MHRHKPTGCIRSCPCPPVSSADLNVQSETLSALRPLSMHQHAADTPWSPPPPERPKGTKASRARCVQLQSGSNTARPKRGAEDAVRAPERRERSKRVRGWNSTEMCLRGWGEAASAPLFLPLTSAAGHSAFDSLRRVTRLVAIIFSACAAGNDCSGSLPGGIATPKEVRPKTSCPASAQYLGRDGCKQLVDENCSQRRKWG